MAVVKLICLISILVLKNSRAFVVPARQRSGTTVLAAASVGSENALVSVLRKPSKTLSVVVETAFADSSEAEWSTRSMQLRKIKASAIATDNAAVAKVLVDEQASARSNFPGPMPVIYTGSDLEAAIQAKVDALVLRPDISSDVGGSCAIIYAVESAEDVKRTIDDASAYLVKGDDSNIDQILDAIPEGSVIIASLTSMQKENMELQTAKALKDKGVCSIFLEKAVVRYNEDLEYCTFVVEGVTKKKSSTFNMSGLTGKANGHFGGVASSQPKTWLRVKDV